MTITLYELYKIRAYMASHYKGTDLAAKDPFYIKVINEINAQESTIEHNGVEEWGTMEAWDR